MRNQPKFLTIDTITQYSFMCTVYSIIYLLSTIQSCSLEKHKICTESCSRDIVIYRMKRDVQANGLSAVPLGIFSDVTGKIRNSSLNP